MSRIYNNIIETVGNTPLVKLNRVTAGLSATILLKCEFFNPLGSVKDRIGMSMIRDAEQRGRVGAEVAVPGTPYRVRIDVTRNPVTFTPVRRMRST